MMARRPGAAPGTLSFGDSVARAGARRRNWSDCRELRPDLLPGESREAGLNYNRESKGAGSYSLPAQPFQQRTNTSW
jgi:hypothetical protein